MTQAKARSGRAGSARVGRDPDDEGRGVKAQEAQEAQEAKEAKEAEASDASVRILKKYPNRRLYDTQTSGYITLADVRQMVLDSERFVVRDAKTGEDLTRSILLQIILEAETGGMPMFTTPVLANLIRFYGHTMQGMMGSYLDKNIQAFTELQTRFVEQAGLVPGQAFSPEVWSQFMNIQAPVMQGLMGSYLEQSKSLFTQMQEQMHKQTGSLFPVGFGLGSTLGGQPGKK